MVAIKIGTLILYLILAYVAISFPLTLGANASLGILVLLVLAHIVECYLYRDLIRTAPGGAAWHLLNVFLFGVFHMIVMKDVLREQETVAT